MTLIRNQKTGIKMTSAISKEILLRVSSQFGLQQVIKEPTHVLNNFSSCVDLTFTSQANMLIESGMHPYQHSNFHHQIIYLKFDVQIFYPPPY